MGITLNRIHIANPIGGMDTCMKLAIQSKDIGGKWVEKVERKQRIKMHFFHSTTGEKLKNIQRYEAIFCARNMKKIMNSTDEDVSFDDEYGYNLYVYGRLIPHFDYGEFCLELNIPAWMLVVNPLGNHILWKEVLTPREMRSFLMPGESFKTYWAKFLEGGLNAHDLQEIYRGRYQELGKKNPLLKEQGIRVAELMVPRQVPLKYLVKTHVKG